MPAFDAELHLRLAAERGLLEPPDPRHGHMDESPSAASARALVAIGALSEETARAVLDEYTSAAALRGHEVNELFHHVHTLHPPSGRPAPKEFEPRRVAALGQEIPYAGGTLRLTYAILGPARTEIGVVGELDDAGFNHGPSLRIKDDAGTQLQAEFAGGWSDHRVRGTFYTMHSALSPTTRAIEVEGHRLELTDRDLRPEVRVEPLPEADPALRHLWHTLAPDEWAHRPAPLDAVIDTLVAAGALAPDHPELEPMRRVHTHLAGRGGAKRGLPEPWRSLRRGHGGRTDGPQGVVVVGAVTPVFDECAIAVDALDSTDDGWTLTVRVTPGDAVQSGFGDGALRPQLVWWAADDRRRTYVGHTGNWGGSEDEGSGVIHFEAPLDPKATYVDVMPTGPVHRAVIRVPLVWL